MAHKKGFRRRLLIDTDAGLDDAQAILMALADQDVEIVGITCCMGNTSVSQVSRNVLRLLKLCDRLDIPVYKGCSVPLLGAEFTEDGYHGKDGFGDVPDQDPADEGLITTENGVTAMVRIVNENPGEITLMALAPLTNVAMAVRLDPSYGKKLKDCFILGGNTSGIGNVTACSEFNFHADAESAMIVLDSLGCSITMACWELCLENAFSLSWYEEYTSIPSKKAQFLKAVERNTYEQVYKANNATYKTADQIPMAAALDCNVVLTTEEHYVTVSTSDVTRGFMIVDRSNLSKRPPNVKIITALNKELYSKMLFASLETS